MYIYYPWADGEANKHAVHAPGDWFDEWYAEELALCERHDNDQEIEEYANGD